MSKSRDFLKRREFGEKKNSFCFSSKLVIITNSSLMVLGV